MSRKLSLGGNDSGVRAPISYFDPLTGGFGSKIRYTQHLDIGRRQSNWLPSGLSMRQVRNGHTQGFKRKRAAEGVPGWVWVKK